MTDTTMTRETTSTLTATRPWEGWRSLPVPVTTREKEVLAAIVDGCSTPEVAARLYLSQKTVKNHLASIYQKLDTADRTQAVVRAVRMGIIRLD